MFQSIVEKLASTAIAVGSLFFTSVTGTNATFENPQIQESGSQVVISANLTNCFTDELDRIIQSGRPVRINFRVTLHQTGAPQVVLLQDFYHEVQYSLVDHVYQVYFSESNHTTNAATLDEMHSQMSGIDRYRVIDESTLTDDTQYYIQIRAYMEKIKLPGMKEEINLMNYWNNTEPLLISDAFSKEDLAL